MGFFDFLKKKELAEIAQLRKHIEELKQYEQVVDAEAEAKRIIEQAQNQADDIITLATNKAGVIVRDAENRKISLESNISALEKQLSELENKYKNGLDTYKRLQREAGIYQEVIELAEYGVYQPHFDFDTSEKYKEEISKIREHQKREIRNESAVLGGENISWNGSIAQGAAMVKREKKLMLRAFNGECDSFIADVDWNNVSRMEERIQKSLEAINKIYDKQGIYISRAYASLKVTELRLAYEYKLKKHEEKEEQRQIREQMREEEKARKEIEAAMLKAQKEEEAYQKALDKARKEVETLQGAQQAKLLSKIGELEARVAEAENNKQRAISMAQQTRRGHVYVISNVGSFGENVYKIGMTRRLDPMDRVRELGDASVPFCFDVHAIIFSEDAPGLEAKLHKQFDSNRLNLINRRREFFNVPLSEIERVVKENHGDIEFTRLAEAQEFRKSEALRIKMETEGTDQQATVEFSSQLFSA